MAKLSKRAKMNGKLEVEDARPLPAVVEHAVLVRDEPVVGELDALEEGLPLVRAANTGISAVVDPYGRVIARLGIGEQGVLDSGLPAALPPTLFARWGELIPMIMAALFLALALVLARRRKSP